MPTAPIRVLMVDDIASTLDYLQKLLSFEDDIEVAGTAADGRAAVETAHELKPDIVLMDVNMPVLDGIQATEQLAQELPASPVIIMSVQGERDYLRRAMQAGAREFLIKPFSGDELIAAIRRVHQLEQKKEVFRPAPAPAGGGPAAAPAPRTSAGELFMLFSGKGGSGKSILASNLATALAMETGAKVALADLDLQFGDVNVLLALDHSRSITDLVPTEDNLEPPQLDEVLAQTPQGVAVLTAPISPELADLVTPDLVRSVIAQLRREYDFVVVDSSTHLNEVSLEVMEQADRLVLITQLNIPAIKDAKVTLRVLDTINIEPERILLVVNRADAHSEFNKEKVEQNLRCAISAQLPYEPRVVSDSVNKGVPFVVGQPDAEISRSIRELVGRLVPTDRTAAAAGGERRRRGRFGFGRS